MLNVWGANPHPPHDSTIHMFSVTDTCKSNDDCKISMCEGDKCNSASGLVSQLMIVTAAYFLF